MIKKRARIIPNERGKEGYRLEKWVNNTGNFIPLDEQELYGLLEDIEDLLIQDFHKARHFLKDLKNKSQE